MPASEHNEPQPRKHKRSSAQDRLIEATRSLMRERDTIDVPLLDIAKRAGVNVALVKYYFGDKDGLLRALLDLDLKRPIKQLNDLVRQDMPPEQKMRIHISGLLRLVFEKPYFHRLILQIARCGPEKDQHEVMGNYIKPVFEAYHVLLKEGAKRKVFRVLDPVIFYFNVVGACDQIASAGLTLRRVYGIDEIDEDLRIRFKRQTTETIMAGIQTPDAFSESQT